jgi:hypothetical protein
MTLSENLRVVKMSEEKEVMMQDPLKETPITNN